VKIQICSRCRSNELIEHGDYLVCAYCRSRFVMQAEDLPPVHTVIGLVDDVRALLDKCKDDPNNRHRYASLVLDIDPTNPEALRYLT